ncbi:MAG TPA: hypothetical protein VF767_12535 [Bryobacteraceae bacterium]
MERLEQIAGRVARAVGSEQSPDQILESASLLAELAREVEAAQNESEEPRARERPRTVLLVSVDAAERFPIRALLDKLGCAVLDVRSGAAALGICAADPGPIDLLVTGMLLPDMSGRELAERVAILRPSLAVLSVSGEAGEDLASGLAEALELEYAG